MKDKATGSLDRRDFVIASLATVGASAAFAATAGTADAQDKTAWPQPTGTVYTGDVIGGKKVISSLDVRDLDPGRKHAFYFQGVQMPTGQHWYVSVMVAKGAKPGKRIALVSGVHGDEISPVHTIQTVMEGSTRRRFPASYWRLSTYPARPWKAWRAAGPIQAEVSTSSTSIASGPAMRTAPVRPLDTPGFCSIGSSNQTPIMRSISILRLPEWTCQRSISPGWTFRRSERWHSYFPSIKSSTTALTPASWQTRLSMQASRRSHPRSALRAFSTTE